MNSVTLEPYCSNGKKKVEIVIYEQSWDSFTCSIHFVILDVFSNAISTIRSPITAFIKNYQKNAHQEEGMLSPLTSLPFSNV